MMDRPCSSSSAMRSPATGISSRSRDQLLLVKAQPREVFSLCQWSEREDKCKSELIVPIAGEARRLFGLAASMFDRFRFVRAPQSS